MTQANHNHITRDIKPLGQCPACDAYHDKNIPKKTWQERRDKVAELFVDNHFSFEIYSEEERADVFLNFIDGFDAGRADLMENVDGWFGVAKFAELKLERIKKVIG